MTQASATSPGVRTAGWRALAACLLLWCATPSAEAGQVLIVRSSDAAPYREAQQACGDTLSRLGHAVRGTRLEDLRDRDLAAALGDDTDAVIALGTPAAVHLHRHLGPATPLFYAMVAQPAAAGLTEGRSAVGVSTDVPLAAQVRLIREALPHTRRVGMLYRADLPASARHVERMRQELPHDWELIAVAVDEHDSLAAAIGALMDRRPGVVWAQPDAAIYNPAAIRTLLLASLRRQTPVFGFSSAFVKAGAMIGVTIEAPTQGEHAAELAHARLHRDEPAGPPVVKPRFEIAVNLTVARTLQRDIPARVLESATVIYGQEDE